MLDESTLSRPPYLSEWSSIMLLIGPLFLRLSLDRAGREDLSVRKTLRDAVPCRSSEGGSIGIWFWRVRRFLKRSWASPSLLSAIHWRLGARTRTALRSGYS